ncbi:DUF1611 domain-containing protein [Litorivicinus sp.]|nr:DUF1611 domain-containing protein [Litorivicinus sp.]
MVTQTKQELFSSRSTPNFGLLKTPKAIIYCEGNFAKLDGKTANGLVRQSETYQIISVIDSNLANSDSGLILDGARNNVPILRGLREAVDYQIEIPEVFIFGMAPSNGRLSTKDRKVILDAISLGMDIVCGLHEFLSEDLEIKSAAALQRVSIRDIRKPKPTNEMRLFDGTVANVKAIRIAVLGTDCAIGKRTTATLLAKALNAQGIKTILIGTGQTGLMQGARYGIAMDALPPQFCCGELEGAIISASNNEQPDVILIEGQGALSHPAFCTSAFILRGSQPHAVILQHAPKRIFRCDFPQMPMPDLSAEISLIEAFSSAKVIGLTINHEEMTDFEIDKTIAAYSFNFSLPVSDALSRSQEQLAELVLASYPELRSLAPTIQ